MLSASAGPKRNRSEPVHDRCWVVGRSISRSGSGRVLRLARMLLLLGAIYPAVWGVAPGAASAQVVEEKATRIVRVFFPNVELRNKILISFEGGLVRTDDVEGYHVLEAGPEEIEKLLAAGLEVVDSPGDAPVIQRLPGFPCYPTVEETFLAAQTLAANSPGLVSWIDVGDSWEKSVGLGGYDMQVLILANASTPGPKPKLLLTCAIHAREYTTSPLCLAFAETLVDGYDVDADATWLLDHHEIHLLLQANPDGRKRAEAGSFWRKNTNWAYCSPTSSNRGVDLNRNFPFNWGCCGGGSNNQCAATYRGPTPTSESETQAVVDYMRAIFPDQRPSDTTTPAPDDASGVYIDVHSYGELVLWPWGYTAAPPPNGTALQTLGRKLAHWNHYLPQQAIGLYPTDGTTDDFGYGDLGVASYTYELGTDFFQACSVFENTILPDNLPTLVYAAKVSRTPYQTPAGPDVTALALDSTTLVAGQAALLTATLDDTLYSQINGTEATQNVAEAEYYVDVPPWNSGTPLALSAGDGAFDASIEGVEGSLTTSGWTIGRHILFVRGRDAAGNWGAVSAIFLEVEAPPEVPSLSWLARGLIVGLVLMTALMRRPRRYAAWAGNSFAS